MYLVQLRTKNIFDFKQGNYLFARTESIEPDDDGELLIVEDIICHEDDELTEYDYTYYSPEENEVVILGKIKC